MREPVRDKGRLTHIVEAIDKAFLFVGDDSVDVFAADTMKVYAVTRCVEIVGEAVYMLSQEFRDSHPDTEWDIITKSRHVMVHGYYQVEPSLVWAMVKNDLPILKEQIVGYLQEFEN